MRFEEILLEMLLEGKIEDTLSRHPNIPEHIKQDYLRQIPANNAQHLDWVLHQHTKGNISPEHNINEILSNFNKVKDKLDKKQIHQYKSVQELQTSISPHLDSIKKSKKEKQEEGTETLYSSPTMTIRQHHNYESCVNAGVLPKNNKTDLDKATWCISVGDGGGAGHYSSYTENGFHPVYSIEHHHPDGTSSKHMFVYDYNKPQYNQELRDEHDRIVNGSMDDNDEDEFGSEPPPNPDLLDHYGSEHPEILKTPIAKFFTEEGRNKYREETKPNYEKYKNLLSSIPQNGMSDEEYMHFFKEGQKKQQGGIHNQLAKSILSSSQLNHLVNHGNEGCSHELATRHDLSDDHMTKLSNTSNMLTHNNLLNNSKLPVDAFNNILNKGHSAITHSIIRHSMFNHNHIDTILNKKLDKQDLEELLKKHHILTDTQFKTILPNVDVYNINKIYSRLSPQHQKLAVDYVQHLKDNNDERWMDYHAIHNHMNMSEIEKVKMRIHNSKLPFDVHQIEHNLSEKELQDHIHPIIDNIIDNAHAFKAKKHLINFAGLINKEQTNRILDNIKGSNIYDIKFAINSNLPNHVRDAIIDRGIKNNNPELVHRTLVSGKNITNIQPHHFEYIRQHLPTHMPSIDKEGVHAKEVIQNAFENPNRENDILLNDIPKSTNKKYKSEYLDHIIKTGHDKRIDSYLSYNSDISHEDLDKILEYSKKHDYLHEGGNLILPKIADIPNLSSSHISHIIASGHLGAIKTMLSKQPMSNYNKQHLDDMIDIKDKEISNKLADYPILGKEQEERNNKVLQESKILFKNNFEKILLETYRDKYK